MVKKYVVASILLVTVGVIVGALLVSSVGSGVDLGVALGSGDPKIGGAIPIAVQNQAVKALSDNFAAVSKAVSPSVVAITTTVTRKEQSINMPRDFWHFFGPDQGGKNPEPQRMQGYGSGVIISADGYIVTNNHVVEGAIEGGIEITLNDKVDYKAKLIGTDPSTDLAVVKIDAKGLTAAALGNSETVQVGEWVVAIGNPLGLTSTVTAGIVSAIGRNIEIITDKYRIEDFIQTDAAINPGNSGGALVNMNGEVIGINSAIATTNERYQGYGFAVPVNLLKIVVADLIKFGEVRRGYLGVTIGDVDQTIASALGMKEAKGVLVSEFAADIDAAQAAGVKEGDVILSVDGREVNKANELQSIIATHHPGDAVTLTLFREGKTLEKKVVLRARAQAVASARNEGDKSAEGETATETSGKVNFEKLGFGVRALTQAEAKTLNMENGVIVADVKSYSEAAERGIRPNDLILEADRKEVSTPADLKRIVEGRKAGESVLLRVKRNEAKTYVALEIPQ